jgi:hypothetical protein
MKLKKTPVQNNININYSLRASGYVFPIWVIQMVIHLYKDTSAGFRTLSNIMKVLSLYINVPVMSNNSIKGWMLRYGYHILTKEKEKRNDNVFINDFSIQLGQQKCLLVLRAPLDKMRKKGFNLSHGQAEVIDLKVVKKSDHQMVTTSLEESASQAGIPKQIVSDCGADIKKGNINFCTNHPDVVYTYDIGHKTACMLKALLKKNDQWKSLLEDINKTLMCVQQTELSFLRPILPRKKSRYLNISVLIYWVQNILRFKDKKDFTSINSGPGYVLNPGYLSKIDSKSSFDVCSGEISKLATRIFQDKEEAIETFNSATGNYIKVKESDVISLGNKRFIEKFMIFEHYREFIEDLSSMVSLINSIHYHVKHNGLSINTMDIIDKSISYNQVTGEKTKQIFLQMINFLNHEIAKFGRDTSSFLGSSDIIESLFGKYKYKLTDRLGSIHSSILYLPVICETLNPEDIMEATKCKLSDVKNWFENMQNEKTMQVKRREAFAAF